MLSRRTDRTRVSRAARSDSFRSFARAETTEKLLGRLAAMRACGPERGDGEGVAGS